ncbi:MAG: sulfotransferase domain-containing protein [Bacteroidetes bacterium]|nr:sulfotransferase domain-containing protein [Bacteroidota bacterium]MBP7398282.1 sulfotransferase domain-containing protein [Chitinophagales bacterium]MBP8753602.1 sulfotransferase domain-containing protein [Chitinophagales bacterium]MBP9188630.1 sulfotransferase domain-containing protein [Chitinophagales bacterium]MBP9547633.1 sulfotransferase domain-containing protein [Chitinophagales bacterium]
MENRWPNFLIVGAARSGTTALHEHLATHPEIFMPLQKEPSFFSFYGKHPDFKDSRNKYIQSPEEYLNLFAGQNEKILGESSTPYLYFFDDSIRNIQTLVPDSKKIKILIILRNPADRAFSQYMHNRRDLREPLSFEKAIAAEKQRMQENWHFDFYYADKGFYYKQVNAYLNNFDHVKIMFFDDLEQQPNRFIKQVLEFLEIESESLQKEIQQRNQSGEMKVKWFKRLLSNRSNPVLNGIRKMMSKDAKKKLRMQAKNLLLKHNLKKVDMEAETRKQLVELYRQDIMQLEKLIQTDLSQWLN